MKMNVLTMGDMKAQLIMSAISLGAGLAGIAVKKMVLNHYDVKNTEELGQKFDAMDDVTEVDY